MSASVPATAAVITVNGVCPAQPKTTAAKTAPAANSATPAKATAKTPAADCKTVITKAEFEKLASGLAPNVTPQLKKQLAGILPRLIAMSNEAKKKGLDKTPRFDETVKFAKMQILSNELTREIQEDAAKVPPEEIAAYYKDHAESFEQFNMDRLFVPRSKQDDDDEKEAKEAKGKDKDDDKEEKLTPEQEKAKQDKETAEADANEQAMNKVAEDLRTRAAAGEDIAKLQKEAFEAAGMKIESPNVNLPKVRRTGLPAPHAAVFELKAGEVSAVISDAGGHYIYKVHSKEIIPLDQASDEIHTTLTQQRQREMMEKITNSFKVEDNPDYFGPGGPGTVPPPPIQNRRNAPGTTPMPQPQTPPPAQPQGTQPK